MKLNQLQKILQAALLADAHAMPLHWNYDADSRAQIINSPDFDINSLNSGEYSTYFKGKNAGAQSHHGDQILHLYEYVKKTGAAFSIKEYLPTWKKYIEEYQWHIDRSSTGTLEHIAFDILPTGIDSSDFCGVALGLPLLANCLEDETTAATNIVERVTMTHNNTLTKDCAIWMVLSLFKIVQGHSIIRAMDMSIEQINNEVFKQLYLYGKELCAKEDSSIAELTKEVGFGCGIEVGLPILVVLVHRHQLSLEDFIIENTKAGADSTSRALVGGALIGAIDNTILPEHLLSQLAYKID